MLSYKDSLKILKETDALIEGHFVLSSGLHSETYIQCAKLLSKPNKAKIICHSLANKIKENFGKIDIILSPAIGGIVIGYEIGKILNVETIFAERSEGIFVLRRGFQIKKNQKVLIVEDVITTGKSSLECSNIVTQANGDILGYACIIDRSNGKSKIQNKIVSQIQLEIPTFNKENLPKHLQNIKAIKPGSRNL